MKSLPSLLSVLCLTPLLLHGVEPSSPRLHLEKRASKIDSRAKEYPEIGFLFTDKMGKSLDTQHAMVNPQSPSQGKLVIWLMGYNESLFERLSDYGLNAIQVHYANKWFDMIPTARRDDGDTLGNLRLEAATGQDHSDLCSIAAPDGMMERAFQFVKCLAKEQPQGHWAQFIDAAGDGLQWDKVIMSGASHGSTTAARFAKHQSVDRVVCFCGPRDQQESWQALPSATAANRYFGFSHVLDSGWTGDHYCRSWEMLGLHDYGPITDVDMSAPPYGNTRRLITQFDVKGDAKRAHSSVTPGKTSAKDAEGKFLHEAVWHYLFNQPVDQTGPATAKDENCAVESR